MAFELPEAHHVARQMDSVLSGKYLLKASLSPACASLIRQGFINLAEYDLAGKKVAAVFSRGKWIFTKFDPDLYFLIALESGGKILYHRVKDEAPSKFHVRMEFEDGSVLTIWILGWGFAKAAWGEELDRLAYPGKLGLSPLDPQEFTYGTFSAILEKNAGKTLKAVLMDQRQIAGIGNGYTQEILFLARLHPKRKAGSLNDSERQTLYQAIVNTIQQAVQLRGSDREIDLFGIPGGYHRLLGERMKGQPCPVCATRIEKISVAGGSVYICPVCQGYL
jgi:formamidopyrimidine-DNA glycosylase